MTSLVCRAVHPPPPPAKIYTEAVLGRGKEEEKFTTKSVHHLVNCFEVHHCTPYISRHYCIALPYNSIHSWGIVHSTHITCSLFTPLAAALSHSTVQPSPRLSACQGKKGRERKRKGGGGGNVSRQKLGPSSHHCTVHTVPIHNTFQAYIFIITQYCSYICTPPNY